MARSRSSGATISAVRDYVQLMREMFEKFLAEHPTLPRRMVAGLLVNWLREHDPDLLAGWLDAQAEHVVWEQLGDMDRSARGHARATASRQAFARAAQAAEKGDTAGLGQFLELTYVVDDERNRKRLSEMTATDLAFVAERHEGLARQNGMQAAFMRALEEQCRAKKKRVGQLFNDAQLSEMWRSVSG